MREARTALIAHPGAELYGSDRVMLETVSALTGAGWRVVVALPVAGPLARHVRERGGEALVVPVPVLRKSALRPRGLVRLTRDTARALPLIDRILTSLRPDLVYVSTVTIPVWIAAAKRRGLPLVCHVHEAERAAPRAVRAGLTAPLLLADRVIVNSRFSLRVLTDSFPSLRSRSAVVYNGVPGPAAARPPRQVLSALRVGYVGRLSPRKGVHIAVEAVAQLAEAGRDVSLDIVGGVFAGYEWYEEQLRSRVRELGLESRIRFHGFRDSVWPSLADVDVVTVPSITEEPFGNTAVEAVLAARPVVVSAAGGLPEAVTGFVTASAVPPGDAAALAAALARAADDWPALSREAADDSRLAERRFGVAAYRHRVLEELAAVAAPRAARTRPAPAAAQ